MISQTDGQMDRQTDKLICGGLGNLWFLQVNEFIMIIIVCECIEFVDALSVGLDVGCVG